MSRKRADDPLSWGDNIIPIVPVDYTEHTSEHPFCWDDTCPDREDQEAIAQVHQAYLDGLITAEDATCIVQGRTI